MQYSDKTMENCMTLGHKLTHCQWRVFLDNVIVDTWKLKFPSQQESLAAFYKRAQVKHDTLRQFMVTVELSGMSFVMGARSTVSVDCLGVHFPKETLICNRVPIFEMRFFSGGPLDRAAALEQTGLLPHAMMTDDNLRLIDEALPDPELEKALKRWHLPTACNHCEKDLAREVGKYCVCRSVKYCDKRCQKKDWAAHKLTCGGHGDPTVVTDTVSPHIRVDADGLVTSLTFATSAEFMQMEADDEGRDPAASSSHGPAIQNSAAGADLAQAFMAFCELEGNRFVNTDV
jgi:hypothetical protein